MSGQVDMTDASTDGAVQPTGSTASTTRIDTTTIHTAAHDAVAASRKERP